MMTGSERAKSFRDQLRGMGYQVRLTDARGNFHRYIIQTPNNVMEIVLVIEEHGFDLFVDTTTITIAEDLKLIKERMNRVPPAAD